MGGIDLVAGACWNGRMNAQTALVTLAWITQAAWGQQPSAGRPMAVLPSLTDPAIQQFNGPHSCIEPTATPRGELLLFLPGTNAESGSGALAFRQTAAACGYHVVSLMYPCDIAAQQACRNDEDPTSYGRFRLEILTGKDLSPHVQVSVTDSVFNRLTKVIQHLARKRPRQGWGQFLDGETILWSKIAVSGQSQGGGHAAMIAKQHLVARVIMFGSPKDYSARLQGPAKFYGPPQQTPLTRFFAFNHAQDKQGACTPEQQWEILRLLGFDDSKKAVVDGAQPPFGGAQVLLTNKLLPDMDMKKIHGAALTQREFEPVWKYLLTAPVP